MLYQALKYNNLFPDLSLFLKLEFNIFELTYMR